MYKSSFLHVTPPTLLTSLSFCQWYKVSNVYPSSYKVNLTGIKWIAHRLKGKVEEKRHGKRVRVPSLEEFLAKVESETSVAASPYSGKVGSEPAQEVAAIATLEKE